MILACTAHHALQAPQPARHDAKLKLRKAYFSKIQEALVASSSKVLFQPAQASQKSPCHCHELIRAKVYNCVEEGVGPPFSESRPSGLQSLAQLLRPTVPKSCGTVLHSNTRAPRPVFAELAIRLRHGDERVQVGRARAESRDMLAPHPNRLLALWPLAVVHQGQQLNGQEVIRPQAVDLGRTLLDDILHAQRMQAVLHSQSQKEVQVKLRHVHPADRPGILGPSGTRSMAEEETAHVVCVDVLVRCFGAAVIHYRKVGSPGPRQEARKTQAAKDSLECLEVESPSGATDALEDPGQRPIIKTRDAAALQTMPKLLHRQHAPIAVGVNARENLSHTLGRAIEEGFQDVLAHIQQAFHLSLCQQRVGGTVG
mmetsp:Transcript_68008/g.159464  ORF Transcript_68008/g.159464 Transcript_68008/m.159464 type:complete len:370 (-) Transcript_68008:367-1476(-)